MVHVRYMWKVRTKRKQLINPVVCSLGESVPVRTEFSSAKKARDFKSFWAPNESWVMCRVEIEPLCLYGPSTS